MYTLASALTRVYEWRTSDEDSVVHLPAGLALTAILKLVFTFSTRHHWATDRRTSSGEREFHTDEESMKELVGRGDDRQVGMNSRMKLDRLASRSKRGCKLSTYIPVAGLAGGLWAMSEHMVRSELSSNTQSS